MSESKQDNKSDAARLSPLPLPRNLREPRRRSILHVFGGKLGLAAILMTTASVAWLGWVAWGKYGKVLRKVFATHVSSSYKTREDYFKKKFMDVESAGTGRKFGFYSIGTDPFIMKSYMEDHTLVIDASDVKDAKGAKAAAGEMAAFHAAGADLENLILRFPPPRDFDQIARVAAELYEKVMDGAPHGMVDTGGRPVGEIRFDDWSEAK